MGCDIHAHGEVKINGVWHHYSQPRIERWYGLFARMADVRNDPTYGIEPISPPRGIPEDITFITRFDYEDECGHSGSWLTGKEVEDLCAWVDEQRQKEIGRYYSFQHHCIGYVFGNGWDVKKYPDDYPKGVEDVRLVFWFDN